ncbi:MAG: heat-inducible transcription repressor HrcA [Bacilli bacterium]|nr:heat-inducible transcription repressor HrcA [Bacilli bacterium]
MITERESKILKLIVEEYIKLAKPVSSNLICKRLKCSSATVRSEMKALEDIGLLEKTHTSSGRVPSEDGYRYYVDNLMQLKTMKAEDMLKLQIIFHNQQLNLSDCISKSLQVVSDMTSYATVILGSTSHENLLKQIEVVPIDDKSIAVIVITNKGHVEHKTITLGDVNLNEVKKTVSLINNLVVGTPIDEVSTKLEFEVKPIIGKYVSQHEQIYNAFYNVFSDFVDSNNVNIVGKNNFLELPEFSNIDKVKNIYKKLDDRELIKSISDVREDDNNIEIYIGKESKIDDDVTVIKTKYKTDTDEGTIAIIGPKRMEYDRVVNMLDYIKKNIER